jgi:YVTN family beta-propeller protein
MLQSEGLRLSNERKKMHYYPKDTGFRMSSLRGGVMLRRLVTGFVSVLGLTSLASAGQVPYAATALDVPVTHHDRAYTADQFSNTVSVIDPADNKLLGVIRLGTPP